MNKKFARSQHGKAALKKKFTECQVPKQEDKKNKLHKIEFTS
jgi:hypothetical protein